MIHCVFTIEEKCTGCNKCIAACPVDCANQVYLAYDGTRKIKVDNNYCIHCGACLKACDHGARDFNDDTDAFMHDLAVDRATPVTVVAAPAAQVNFPHMKNLFGWLKTIGVAHIYDVSLGADITTWAYLRAKKELNVSSMLAQPCPSVVNFCERYMTELIDSLAPIQSPLMCLAIYLRKYMKLKGKIAFLSPCIAKAVEINDPNTKNLVQYNVTFAKLYQKIQDSRIDLSQYPERGFEGMPAGIGHVYSRPGGLIETVHLIDDNIWTRHVDSPAKVYDYLRDYLRRKQDNLPLPEIIDVLNCDGGCNRGTGTAVDVDLDDIDNKTNIRKRAKENSSLREINGRLEYIPHVYFDENLNWQDFRREYTNRDTHGFLRDTELEDVFMTLKKKTPDSRNINCYACGYGSCKRFAQAVKRGINIPESCIDYERNMLKIDRLTLLLNHGELEAGLNRFTDWYKMSPFNLVLMMMDLDNFKGINDNLGHDVGDNCLRFVASIIARHVRPNDAPGRWGGDEFMVIFPHTELSVAAEVANKIRQSILEARILPNGKGISTSIGLAEARPGDKQLDLFRRADKALYTAKQHKKNPKQDAVCIIGAKDSDS